MSGTAGAQNCQNHMPDTRLSLGNLGKSDTRHFWLDSLTGEAHEKGAETTERGVADGHSQENLIGGPMVYCPG